LADGGVFPWRDEAFDVRAEIGQPVLSQIDRGALPLFGIIAEGVHINGLVQTADGLHLWLARRAADRPLDPGKLDHLAAGGIPAGLDARQTLVKEAQEEAGLPQALAETALFRGLIRYTMERPEGLRRDALHCYDLILPESFTPSPMDGEAAGFELWPIGRVLEAVRDSDVFKFNVNLVLIDLFLRTGTIDRASPVGQAVAAAMQALRPPA
jgi:8-oxo-dGTP pyrophosphatase MutT (NUDIX family)